jgi:hypothetical protein
MMRTMKKIEINYRYFEIVVFILFFSCLYYMIEPALLYVVQDNVFFTTVAFFQSHLSYPGGLIDYLNAFFTELLVYSWLGALVFTGFAVFITFTTYWLLRILNVKKKIYYLHLLPLSGLIIFYSTYAFELYFLYSLGIVIVLYAFILFIRLKSSSLVVNTALAWILASVVYYCALDMAYFFIILCIVNEINPNKKSLFQGLLFLVAPLTLPFVSYKYFFLINQKEAYLKFFDMETIAPVFLVFLMLYLLIIAGNNYLKNRGIERLKNPLIAMPLILALLAGSVFITFDPEKKLTNKYLYLGKNNQWDKIIELAAKTTLYDNLTIFMINRAYCHKNLLLSRFFSIPQELKLDGLILSREYSVALPLLKSDLYMDLGHLNQANHWAHEGLSTKGEIPLILRRLAEVNMAKGEIEAARMFLLKLKNTLWQKKWAESCLASIEEDATLANLSEIQAMRRLILNESFICRGSMLQLDLENILDQGKGTRMTYEYLMLYYLMEKNFKKFLVYLKSIDRFSYKSMPKIFSEAFVVYLASTKQNVKQFEEVIDPAIIIRFNEFQSVLKSVSQNVYGMRNQLFQKFGDTYWYYLIKQDQLK